ncbi:MAG: hypothetical protein FWH19_05320 [Treponema sp.]|nr:hypothetical protein [Treponema sp.]
MRKILLFLFCVFPLSLLAAEEVFFAPMEYNAIRDYDFRNKYSYAGSNDMDDMDIFFLSFNELHRERLISNDNDQGPRFRNLPAPERTILFNLLERGRGIPIPNNAFSASIICDDTHGVILFWARFPAIMGDPAGYSVMFRQFFELKQR